MNCFKFIILFVLFPTSAAALGTNGGQNGDGTDYKPILSKCCKDTLKNETVDCDALVGGNLAVAGFNLTRWLGQTKANGEQISAYLFTCVFTNYTHQDHRDCCRAANATDECLPLCVGDVDDASHNPFKLLFGDLAKTFGLIVNNHPNNALFERLVEFFDGRQCYRFIMPALSGQQCHPIPFQPQTSADGLQQRFFPILPILMGGVLVTVGGGTVLIPAGAVVAGVGAAAAAVGAGIGAAIGAVFG